MYNVKREKLHNLGLDTLKTLLLREIMDEWIDILNFMGKGDVSQISFEDIFVSCKNISRGKEKYGRSPQDPIMERVSNSTSGLVSQAKLRNFLDILGPK